MLNKISKLNSLIHATDQNSWRALGQYIQLFSNNKRIQQLYANLEHEQQEKTYTKAAIFSAAFGDEPYDDNAYRQIVYQFKKIYDQFILSSSERNAIDDQVRLARHYKENNIQLKSPKTQLAKQYQHIESIQDYKAIYYLETEKMDEILQLNDRTKEPNLQMLNDVLDKLYLIEKFKLVCSAINYANINQYEYDFGLINELEDKVRNTIMPQDGLLYGMFKVYQLMKYREESFFVELHQWIQQAEIQHNSEFELIFLMMNNYCIRQINRGNAAYFQQLFLLNKITIENGLILDEHGLISPHAAKNIIAVSLRLKEFTWTKEFIENATNRLKEEHREETTSYLWARYAYELKDYARALKHLAITLPIDMLNNSSFRVLQLKCLYELDDYEMMDTALENFRLYLIRHKNQTNYYYSNVNFIAHLKKIIKNKDRVKTSLIQKIQEEKLVAEKAWLISLLQ